MAITPLLREDGSRTQTPWDPDLDGKRIILGNAGSGGGTLSVNLSGGVIVAATQTGFKQHAFPSSADIPVFPSTGVIRGKVSISHVGVSDQNKAGLEWNLQGSALAEAYAVVLSADSGTLELQTLKSQVVKDAVATTIAASTMYELIINQYDYDHVRAMKYAVGSFPDHSDYKTLTWDTDSSGWGNALDLLDDFNRADQNPIAGNWTNKVYTTSADMKILSNQIAPVASNASAYWNTRQFSGVVGVQFKITAMASTSAQLQYALNNPGTSNRTQYYMSVGMTFIRIVRTDLSGDTTIGADFSHTHANGDIYKVTFDGTTHTVYKNGAFAFSRTDSTYSSTGYIGVGCSSNAIRLDDFYGGEVSNSGRPGIYSERILTASASSHQYDDVLAFSGGSVTCPTIALTPAGSALTVHVVDAPAAQKRGAAWYFLRYKTTSQPTDENDGTLWTGSAGSGFSGSAPTAEGLFYDAPTDFNITGLSNGTTYYVRPFAVQVDGTISAGTAVSAAPAASDTTPPIAPLDFTASYHDPFVDARIDLSGTNPAEPGDQRINYRTDGLYPASPTDASATVLLDWTAYTSTEAMAQSATGLTDGLEYRFGWWHRDAANNISSGAFVKKAALDQTTLVTPADDSTDIPVSGQIFQWTSDTGRQLTSVDTVHFILKISETSGALFEDGVIFTADSSQDVTQFEYDSTGSGNWVSFPTTGLDSAFWGNDVRYRMTAGVLENDTNYHWNVVTKQLLVAMP